MEDKKICVCCGKKEVPEYLHWLCAACYKSNGHQVKGNSGCSFDPHAEYSSGGYMARSGL